jgi:nickel-dependent lactate racemase
MGMPELDLQNENITQENLEMQLRSWLAALPAWPQKVLLLPPDFTRYHSKAGLIVKLLYNILRNTNSQVEIMPALGTHVPMSEAEKTKMFGEDIPAECFIEHDWRRETVKIGEIPSDFIAKVSEGLVQYPIDVMVNRRLLDSSYDQIISVGQVVPHEVVGMANFNKNIFVGCGGPDMIHKSHFLGAAYGMERMMGRADTPVRKVFNYAEERFLKNIPLQYMLTVTTTQKEETQLKGLFIGRSKQLFEKAVLLSQRYNLNLLDKPFAKVVVYLSPDEFKSTWLGNKAIYRTRMAIADGGELLILAPGVKHFGEDQVIDGLIRKYGYVGSKRVLQLAAENPDLAGNLSAAAHLIHGSSEGRFTITYATAQLSRREVEQVNFRYSSLSGVLEQYNPAVLTDGYNTLADGEEIYFISNPALGLWADRNRFMSEA